MSLAFARTPDGYRLEVSRRIDAPPDTLWDLLCDTTRWSEWGPSVRGVECDRRYIEAGTRGRVKVADLAGGVWAPFEVTTCADRRWTWKVGVPTTALLRNTLDPTPTVPATGHRVEAVGRGSRVVFEVPPLAAGYAAVCRRALDDLERLVRDTEEQGA
ncbi:SRPBCC family protein [Halomarina ordinaria]|uniref:SRPBCC family protein n=1 Tax=Halomarina ordinaria TaxID=3033939 RepID=A0ABD5U5J7_9EURY|nr:SRPBCC family protein [Halomarina sp. PSRA2]